MGGYESRVQQPLPTQNFSASVSVPARVKFSPDLLTQLQKEQEDRFQTRSPPQNILSEVDDPVVEAERAERLKKAWEELEQKKRERVIALQEESKTANKLLTSLADVSVHYPPSRPAAPEGTRIRTKATARCGGDAHNALSELEDNRNILKLLRSLKQYEQCVERQRD